MDPLDNNNRGSGTRRYRELESIPFSCMCTDDPACIDFSVFVVIPGISSTGNIYALTSIGNGKEAKRALLLMPRGYDSDYSSVKAMVGFRGDVRSHLEYSSLCLSMVKMRNVEVNKVKNSFFGHFMFGDFFDGGCYVMTKRHIVLRNDLSFLHVKLFDTMSWRDDWGDPTQEVFKMGGETCVHTFMEELYCISSTFSYRLAVPMNKGKGTLHMGIFVPKIRTRRFHADLAPETIIQLFIGEMTENGHATMFTITHEQHVSFSFVKNAEKVTHFRK